MPHSLQNRRLLRRTAASHSPEAWTITEAGRIFLARLESGEAIEGPKETPPQNKCPSVRNDHSTGIILGQYHSPREAARRPAAGRYSELNGTPPGTGIFGPETGAEKRTDPRTETATNKARAENPANRGPSLSVSMQGQNSRLRGGGRSRMRTGLPVIWVKTG